MKSTKVSITGDLGTGFSGFLSYFTHAGSVFFLQLPGANPVDSYVHHCTGLKCFVQAVERV